MARIKIGEVTIFLTRKEAKELKDRISTELTTFVNKILVEDGLQVDEEYAPRYIDELLEIIKDDDGFLKELTKKTEKQEDSILVDVIKIRK